MTKSGVHPLRKRQMSAQTVLTVRGELIRRAAQFRVRSFRQPVASACAWPFSCRLAGQASSRSIDDNVRAAAIGLLKTVRRVCRERKERNDRFGGFEFSLCRTIKSNWTRVNEKKGFYGLGV